MNVMPATDLRRKTRLAAIVTGLLTVSGIGIAAAPPASAAEVFRERYSSEYVQADTSSMSADGCSYSYISASAGTSSPLNGASTMYYSSSEFNKCTGQSHFVYGEAATQVFTFQRGLVHTVATVPLSDGSQIHLDLTWQGTGKVERGGSNSRNVLPGQFVQRYAYHGTLQEATVTGTLSFENAYISASKSSSMTVTISMP